MGGKGVASLVAARLGSACHERERVGQRGERTRDLLQTLGCCSDRVIVVHFSCGTKCRITVRERKGKEKRERERRKGSVCFDGKGGTGLYRDV